MKKYELSIDGETWKEFKPADIERFVSYPKYKLLQKLPGKLIFDGDFIIDTDDDTSDLVIGETYEIKGGKSVAQ